VISQRKEARGKTKKKYKLFMFMINETNIINDCEYVKKESVRCVYFLEYIIFLLFTNRACQFAPIELTELAAYVFTLGKLLGRSLDRVILVEFHG
jgi:hypothetical protein